MKYNKSKIYQSINDITITDDIYISSTYQALSKRMAEYRISLKSKARLQRYLEACITSKPYKS